MGVVRPFKTRRSSDIVAAIDVGASKAACLIAALTQRPDGSAAPEILGVGVQGAAPNARDRMSLPAEAPLRAAVAAAERMAGERVRSVFVGAPGRSLLCRRIAAEIDLEMARVAREDVLDCLAQATAEAAPHRFRLLHALPIAWSVDGEDAGPDPVGAAGAQLAGDILGISARENRVANLETLVERCGLLVEDVFAAPLAAAETTLLDDEKDLGVVLLDIGADSTGYAVFRRGALVECGGAPIGGAHITRDIAQVFGTGLADAERAKTLHGACAIASGDEHSALALPQIGDADEIKITRSELSTVISPRMEEIFELTIDRLGVERAHVPRRAVLTGGGSLLVGARECAERVLGMRARLGRPAALAGAPEAVGGPQFSVCAGLLLLAAKRSRRKSDFDRRRRARGVAVGGTLSRIGAWLLDNF